MGGRGAGGGFPILSGDSFEIEERGFKPEFFRVMKQILIGLDKKYDNYIYKVERSKGAFSGEGGSIDQGGTMRIFVQDPSVIIHEFAHGIASTLRDDNGLSSNKDFWKEISKVRTEYRKAIQSDYRNSLGVYANSGGGRGRGNLNEFMAEGFTISYAKSIGVSLNSSHYNVTSQSLRWANEVKSVVDKYFKKKKK